MKKVKQFVQVMGKAFAFTGVAGAALLVGASAAHAQATSAMVVQEYFQQAAKAIKDPAALESASNTSYLSLANAAQYAIDEEELAQLQQLEKLAAQADGPIPAAGSFVARNDSNQIAALGVTGALIQATPEDKFKEKGAKAVAALARIQEQELLMQAYASIILRLNAVKPADWNQRALLRKVMEDVADTLKKKNRLTYDELYGELADYFKVRAEDAEGKIKQLRRMNNTVGRT